MRGSMKPEVPNGVKLMLDLGKGLWIARSHIDKIREQTLNARVMTKDMMERLAKNIKTHGNLESLPYCALVKKPKLHVEVISGHHRIRASRMANMLEIHYLLDTNNLTRDDIVARQLAHNSIQGFDDKEMLKKLFSNIKDSDIQLEAFIHPKDSEYEVGEQV